MFHLWSTPKAKCRHERIKRLMVQSLSVHTALLLMFSLNFAVAHTAYTRHDFSISSMSLLTNKYVRSLPRHTVNGFVNIFRTSQGRCRTKFPLGFSLYSFPLNMVQWTWRYRWWASMSSLLNLVSASSSTNFSKVGVVTMETDSWRWARAARSLMTMIDVAMRMTRKIHGSTVA